MAIRQSFLREHIPEALRAVGCDEYKDVAVLPTQRGSVLLVQTKDEMTSIVKIADRSITETEVCIQPPRSTGIVNEAETLKVLPSNLGPRLEAFKDLRSSVVSRISMLRGTSADRIKPEDLNENFLADVYKGLTRLHEAGFIHGDVQPGNVFLTDQDIRFIDFEFAQKIGNMVHNSGQAFFLSPRAAAAELNGENYVASPYEDLFAFCAVSLALTNGHRSPFGGDVSYDVQRKRLLEKIAEGACRYHANKNARFFDITSKIAELLNDQSHATANEKPIQELLQQLMDIDGYCR